MDRETRRYIRELAYFAGIGLTIAFSIFIGLAVGLFLDGKFGTSPWLTLFFMGLGIVAGFRNIGMAIRRIRKY